MTGAVGAATETDAAIAQGTAATTIVAVSNPTNKAVTANGALIARTAVSNGEIAANEDATTSKAAKIHNVAIASNKAPTMVDSAALTRGQTDGVLQIMAAAEASGALTEVQAVAVMQIMAAAAGKDRPITVPTETAKPMEVAAGKCAPTAVRMETAKQIMAAADRDVLIEVQAGAVTQIAAVADRDVLIVMVAVAVTQIATVAEINAMPTGATTADLMATAVVIADQGPTVIRRDIAGGITDMATGRVAGMAISVRFIAFSIIPPAMTHLAGSS